MRIHASSQSADISHGLNARAFTTGRDIYFGHREYNPQSSEGKRLNAHELTHIVQQGQAGQINNNLISRAKIPKKTVTVNITNLHGATGSATSALTYANTKVYNQANTEIKKGKDVTLNEPKSKAILGPDLTLDEYTDPTKPTGEEKKLFKENQTAGAVTMYFVKASILKTLGEAQWPALATGLVGFVVNNIGTDNTFSHELGHVLLDSGSHAVPDATYLMHATAPDPKKLTPDEIKKIRVSHYVK